MLAAPRRFGCCRGSSWPTAHQRLSFALFTEAAAWRVGKIMNTMLSAGVRGLTSCWAFTFLVGYSSSLLSILGKEIRRQKADPLPSSDHAASASDGDDFSVPSPKDAVLRSKQLLSFLKITDFQLPNEDFGPLKLEKLQHCSEGPIEPLRCGMAGRRQRRAGRCPAAEGLAPERIGLDTGHCEEGPAALPGQAHPEVPGCTRQAQEGLSSSMVLLTPVSTITPGEDNRPAADACSPAFPILGTTPAPGSQAHCVTVAADVAGNSCSTPPLSHSRATVSLAGDCRQCDTRTSPLKLESSLHAPGRPSCDCASGPRATPPPIESLTFKDSQCSGHARPEPRRHSVQQVQSASYVACPLEERSPLVNMDSPTPLAVAPRCLLTRLLDVILL